MSDVTNPEMIGLMEDLEELFSVLTAKGFSQQEAWRDLYNVIASACIETDGPAALVEIEAHSAELLEAQGIKGAREVMAAMQAGRPAIN